MVLHQFRSIILLKVIRKLGIRKALLPFGSAELKA
jgi:hypothetical protein